jgi:GMP synthase PP-ATPase subunit
MFDSGECNERNTNQSTIGVKWKERMIKTMKFVYIPDKKRKVIGILILE